MISSFLCYDICQAVNLHFRTSSYDFFKYQGQTKTKKETFEAKKDIYFYQRLAAKCINEQHCVEKVISNISKNNFKPIYIRNVREDVYVEYCALKENFFYNIKNYFQDLYAQNVRGIFRPPKEEYSVLFQDVLSEKLSIEYFICLNILTNNAIIELQDSTKKDDIVWQQYKERIRKYQPFIQFYWDIGIEENKRKFKDILSSLSK